MVILKDILEKYSYKMKIIPTEQNGIRWKNGKLYMIFRGNMYNGEMYDRYVYRNIEEFTKSLTYQYRPGRAIDVIQYHFPTDILIEEYEEVNFNYNIKEFLIELFVTNLFIGMMFYLVVAIPNWEFNTKNWDSGMQYFWLISTGILSVIGLCILITKYETKGKL